MKNTFFMKHLMMFLLPLLIPIIILGTLSILISQSYLKEDINKNSVNLLKQTKENIEFIVSETDPMMLVYDNDLKIIDALSSIMRNRSLSHEDLISFDLLKSFLNAPANARQYIDSFYIYLPNDNGRFISSKQGLSELKSYDDTQWFEQFQRQDEHVKLWIESRYIKSIGQNAEQQRRVTIYQRINNGRGVLVLNILPGYIENILRSLSTFPDQCILVVNEKNEIVFSDKQPAYLTSLDLASILPSGQTFYTVKTPDQSLIVTQLTSVRYGWKYISIVPQSALYQVPFQIIKITIWLLLISFILGSMLALYMTQRSYSERRYKLQASQLMALQSQINPHFLFNTLETLNWETIALTGRPNQVTRIIDNLSEILRYSLTDPEESVTLDTEISSLEHYLQIQKYRYEDKFDVVLDYDSAVLHWKVMKLMLQPIVENSIYHGIKEKEGPGRIKIKIRQSGPYLDIAIVDNGLGMSREVLQLIRSNLNKEEGYSQHIGLLNTNKRLVLAYGETSRITIRSKEGWGTAIYFKVPARA